jgi:hypothetical protein
MKRILLATLLPMLVGFSPDPNIVMTIDNPTPAFGDYVQFSWTADRRISGPNDEIALSVYCYQNGIVVYQTYGYFAWPQQLGSGDGALVANSQWTSGPAECEAYLLVVHYKHNSFTSLDEVAELEFAVAA